MYDVVNSKYTYKGTDVLINKLNIKDEALLKEYETRMVSFKLVTIQDKKLPPKFDDVRLKFIHKYLFEEIYDFAGEYREENITKDNFKFAQYEYIEENLKLIVSKVDIDKLKELSFDDTIKEISYYMTELNVLHPFRDGNGRAIREYIRELLQELNLEICFQDIDYSDIIRVSKLAIIDDSEQIELLKRRIKKIN